ncbi:T9SS type A sorting domain-containing protein [Microvirga sp. STS02]|uniref:right-handed parallel beta-helix repeat-containing protein n=1 Tax=Hymenobacter negativus TaxID=2795026 RepID=UPI0018DE54EB|nr:MULTISPECIES: T9SS type A sorting domain-containing protein [Bacteria]MBH8570009.1 T9SS type A sorting domain-containing protein [Hymenobacter negativus]MBR7209748.1 T9SS type A sorting domain-containing protein [Microvirga sp. STS02]
MFKHYFLALLLALSCGPAFSAKYYVAPTGNDANSGTIQQPFLTIQQAQTVVSAGDTVWVRGGTYLMSNANISGHSTAASGSYIYITLLSKSGSATAGRINYWAYPGERPVFNYASVDPNVTNTNTVTNPTNVLAPYRVSAFEVTGSYIHLRGLEVVGVRVPRVSSTTNTLSICFSQSGAGGNNIYERLSMHDGQAIGFYLTRGPNNLILNCDAYRNNDNINVPNSTGTANGGNVDGFGCHPNRIDYTGNVFRGCRAWQNSDDGYDCISAYTATTFENCWAFYNGYTQNFVTRGDGNGFKAGGYGSTALTGIPNPVPSNTVRFCVSVRNRSNGFYSNHHLEGSTWLNNTAYNNAVNFDMLNRKARNATDFQTEVPGYHHTLRNNISLLPRSTNAATRDLNNYDATPGANTTDHNTFLNSTVTVDPSDFVSLDTTLLRSPRQADGSLPVIATLRLASGSDLIDAGIDVGFPYSGAAPDLGAYEFATLWTGAVSTDWFDAANWTGGVPTATTDAFIPTNAAGRYPLLSTGTATARNLTINAETTIGQSGGTLSLTGSLINNGTFAASGGTLATSGSASQTLGGSSVLTVQNLIVGPAGAALGSAARFRGVLTLQGNLTTNGQALTLLSSVSNGVATDGLVVNSGGAVLGTVTVQRAIDPSMNTGLGYRQYAAPVSNTTVADLATTASGGSFAPVVNPAYNSAAAPGSVRPFPTVFGYDDSRLALTNNMSSFDKGWFSPAALTDALAVGRGYTVNIGAGELVDFQGTLTDGDQLLSLPSNRANYPDGGWQLLGNPYPAPLDYSRVAPADRPGLEDAIYVFGSSAQYAGQYRSYVNNVGNPVLPVGQAFFARVAAGQSSASLTFRNGQRLTAPSATTFQRATAETRPLAQLTLQGVGRPLVDETTLYFENGATSGFDAAYDAGKLSNPSGLNLSTGLAGHNLSINGQPILGTAQRVVPLAVGVPQAGTYTLTATQLLNLSTTAVYLRDVQLGTLTDLTQQPIYQFTVTNAAALNTTRFELVFAARSALAVASAALAQQVALYPNPAKNQVAIELPFSLSHQPVTAALVDALGRTMQQRVLPAGLAAHVLPLPNVAPGIYSLRLTTEMGMVVKKLIVE